MIPKSNMEEEKNRWLGMHLVKGLGATSFWRLIDHFGSASKCLEASGAEIKALSGVRANVAGLLIEKGKIELDGKQEREKLGSLGGTVIFPWESNYPSLLKTIHDPPPVLFALGQQGLLESDCIAMVGSRSSTGYGRRVAFQLGNDLAARGVCVVSGLALGIDGEAHAGALKAGGGTIGVLGCGLDVIYPRQNSKLYGDIAKTGLLLTEYPLGTSPEAFRFPQRNRIIAGISRGVLVVEAARKSGSLITAQLALDENREVFAVPGQIDSYKSEGAHFLLQQGAILVQSADDILAQYPDLVNQAPKPEEIGSRHQEGKMVDENENKLLEALEPYAITRDQLIEKTGLEPARISELLLFLELDGKVELLPGDKVRRLV